MLTITSTNYNYPNYQPAFRAKNIEQIRSNLKAMEKEITLQDQEVIRTKAAKLNFGQKIVQFFKKLINNLTVNINRLNNMQSLLASRNISSRIEDGMLVVTSDYTSWRGKEFAGITEDELFKYIKRMEKNANFICSYAKTTGNIEYIGGDAIFRAADIKRFPKLKNITGDVNIYNSNLSLKDFDKVKIGGTILA